MARPILPARTEGNAPVDREIRLELAGAADADLVPGVREGRYFASVEDLLGRSGLAIIVSWEAVSVMAGSCPRSVTLGTLWVRVRLRDRRTLLGAAVDGNVEEV